MHKGEIQVRITSYEKICCDFLGEFGVGIGKCGCKTYPHLWWWFVAFEWRVKAVEYDRALCGMF